MLDQHGRRLQETLLEVAVVEEVAAERVAVGEVVGLVEAEVAGVKVKVMLLKGESRKWYSEL